MRCAYCTHCTRKRTCHAEQPRRSRSPDARMRDWCRAMSDGCGSFRTAPRRGAENSARKTSSEPFQKIHTQLLWCCARGGVRGLPMRACATGAARCRIARREKERASPDDAKSLDLPSTTRGSPWRAEKKEWASPAPYRRPCLGTKSRETRASQIANRSDGSQNVCATSISCARAERQRVLCSSEVVAAI
jgi:hypothetical protein